MKIPTQNNIIDILNASLENTKSIINAASSVVEIANNSILIDKNAVKNTEVALKAVKGIICSITESFIDINSALSELNSLSTSFEITSIVSNPMAIVNMAKGVIDKNSDSKTGVLDNYVKLMAICGSISAATQNINNKNIRKSKKSIIVLVETVLKVYKKLYKKFYKSAWFGIESTMIEALIGSTGLLFNFISFGFEQLQKIVEISSGIKSRDISKSVSKLFIAYRHIIFKCSELAVEVEALKSNRFYDTAKDILLLSGIFGAIFTAFIPVMQILLNLKDIREKKLLASVEKFEKVFHAILKVFSSKSFAPSYMQKKIIKLGYIAGGVMPLLLIIFENVKTLIDYLVYIGKYAPVIKFSIYGVRYIFGAKDSVVSELSEFNIERLKNLSFAIPAATMLGAIFMQLQFVIPTLVLLGKNFKNVYFGLKALKLMFSGTQYAKGIFKAESIIDILKTVKKKDINRLFIALQATFIMSAIALQLNYIVNLLVFAGKNKNKIKKGLKAIEFIILGKSYGLFGKKKHPTLSLIAIFSSVTKEDFKNLLNAMPAIMAMSFMLIILSKAIKSILILGILLPFVILGIKAISIVVSFMEEVILQIAKINQQKAKKANKTVLKYLLPTFLSMGFVISVIAGLIPLLGLFSLAAGAALIAMGTIAGIFAIYIGIGYLIKLRGGKPKGPGELNEIDTEILAIAGSIAALVFAFGEFEDVSFNFATIAIFAASVLVILPVFLLISKLGNSITFRAAAIVIMMGGAITTFALALHVVSHVEINLPNILKFALATAVIGLILIGIGALGTIMGVALAGMAALTIGVLALIILAGELMIISQIDVSKIEEAREKAKAILGIVKGIMADLFYANTIDKESDDTWATKFIKFCFGSLANILSGLLGIPMLIMALVSVGAILIIAGELWLLQQIKLDKNKIKDNVDTIFGICNGLWGRLSSGTTDTNPGDEGVFGALIRFISPGLANLLGAIFSMIFVATSLISISCILLIAGELKLIEKLDFNETTETTINNKIDSIFRVIFRLNSKLRKGIYENRTNDSILRKALCAFLPVGPIMDAIDAISNFIFVAQSMIIIGMIGFIGKELNTLQKIDLAEGNIYANVNKIFSCMDWIFAQMTSRGEADFDEDLLDPYKDLTEILSDFVKTVNKLNTKTVDPFVKVIDKVNKVDTSKVKSVTEMFSEMSRFSESIDGNLDKLSEILSDRLIDALEKLSGILEGTKNTTGKTSVIASQPVQTQQVNNEKENKLAIQNANTFKNIESTLEEINSIVSIIKSNTDKKNLHFS